MPPLLLAHEITKDFGAARALKSARLELNAGEIHALVGENGAGKSTLARILSGSTSADSGRISLDGEHVSLGHPLNAQRLGIGIIHQELDLFPHLTVGENLIIGNLRFAEGPLVDPQAIEEFCRPFLEQVGLAVGTQRWVASLAIAEQQLVAIARALSMKCRILLMDEPTSALSEDAAERLFEVMARLKSQGVSIVYVSHKMEEIFRLCDRLTVLRDGQTVGTSEIAATDRAEVIRMMVGRSVEVAHRRAEGASDSVVLSVAHLSTQKLRDVSFDLHRGEVLGIAGLLGAGRSELGAALFGLDRIRQGSMHLNGEPFLPKRPALAMRAGLGLVPEDRRQQGLMLHMTVLENSTLSVLPRLSRLGILRSAQEKGLFDPIARRLRLKCGASAMPVGTLSGGNQQKALLARWVFADPDVLFLDDPARGIDVAAKEDIYALIQELTASGKSIILASSELTELLRCADRILVLHNGRVSGIFPANAVTQESIMTAATRANCA
jgi:ABC-type sugar transport system ATPase subunit